MSTHGGGTRARESGQSRDQSPADRAVHAEVVARLAREQAAHDPLRAEGIRNLRLAAELYDNAARTGDPLWREWAQRAYADAQRELAPERIAAVRRADRAARALDRGNPHLAGRGQSHVPMPDEVRQPLGNAERTMARQSAQMGREVAVVFDREGHVYQWSHGNSQDVTYNVREPGMIVSHTHPTDLSFSREDIRSAIEDRLSVMRTVTPGYTYSMLPRRDGTWPSASTVESTFNRYYAAMSRRLLGHPAGTEELIHHLAWRATARELGMRYYRQTR